MLVLINSFILTNFSVAANAANNQPSPINTINNSELSWSQNDLANITRKDGTLELIIGVGIQPSSINELTKIITQNAGNITKTLDMDTTQAIVVSVYAKDATQVANQITTSGYARYIELNEQDVKMDYVPNDASWSLQWGLQKIGADYAWNTTKGNSTILVAVIDSGIDYNHPDLKANYVPLGYDFVNNDTDPLDDDGHGTACAGIIAAAINNEVGIAGLAQVKVMAEKMFSATGGTEYSWMAQSIIHATDAGANILSCSWYTWGDLSILRDAVNYAVAHGVLVVASAGNTGLNLIQYPAAYDDVVSVSATDSNDTIASFSSFGNWVDVAAPGVNVYTTSWTENYSYVNGTSFSCPMAAGVAALIWSKYSNITSAQVKYQLERTCDDLGAPGFDIYYGNGRVNAQKAVETPLPAHDLVLKNWQGLQGTARNETGIQPGESKLLSATVTNFGSTTETSIIVQFMVNGTVLHSEVIPQLTVAASATVNYTWAPTKEGVYNITTYIQPVLGETSIVNNARSIFTSDTYKIALITDGGSSFATVQNYRKVFDNIWVTYDLYPSNYFGNKYYTANLTLLQQYKAVIWDEYSYDRTLTDAEITALNAYLASGGNLLVTTQGPVDSRLAAVIRSTVGDIYYSPSGDPLYSLGGLVVVNATNPIMDGHYGLFPVGYNYTGYFSMFGDIVTDITADTSRNASVIATTTDGVAKIILTSGLPGKVVFWNGGDYGKWSSQADCEAIIHNLLLWFMDDNAPSTTADYDGAWHISDFIINLNADDFFGVNQTYYRINGGATETITAEGQPRITTEGSNNTLEYWSVDFNGNKETHHSLTQIRLDKTAPIANAGGDKTVTLGDSVTLSNVGSYDANGIASYTWVLGDGTQASGASVTHVYASAGTFTVKLTVQDTAGNTGSSAVSVVVNPKPVVTVTPTPTATPTVTPTPTAVPLAIPTSTVVPDTSRVAFPEWAWIAVIVVVVVFGVVIGAVFVKRQRRVA
jgi:thermitase